MSLRAHFWTTWAGEFLFWAAMTESILFLFQRISVAIQRFNAVLLHDGFPSEDHTD